MGLTRHDYVVDGTRLTGYFAVGESRRTAPGILVAHEAPGLSEHAKERAQMLAARGYVAFALDLYGETDLPLERARQYSEALMADAALLRRRARAALDVLAGHDCCDASRMAVIGFCLGGVVALELARDQAPIRCAVGFHPGLMRPRGSTTSRISAKILMMIGEEDPIVAAQDRESFVREMKDAGADWQLHLFGGVGHSFTNRQIDALGYPGFRYDESADRRAWRYMLDLLDEPFDEGR
jgi:dienelactone hydrolase